MQEFKKLSGIVNGTMGDIYIIDFETTGLNCDVDEIIEIGAIKLDRNGNIEQQIECLVMPSEGKKVSQEITAINGITDDMLLESGLTQSEAARLLHDFLWMGEYSPTIIAHNAHFDLSFLVVLMERNGYPESARDFIALDSLTILKDRKGYPHTLSDAANHYDVGIKPTHRAIFDCKATYEILLRMEHEKDDFHYYRNLIGYNPKYGISGRPVGEVLYLPQISDYEKPLYRETVFEDYRIKTTQHKRNPRDTTLIFTYNGKYGLGKFDYFRGDEKIHWLLPMEYDNIYSFGFESKAFILYQNNRQGLCIDKDSYNESSGDLFATECIYDYIQKADLGFLLRNEFGVQYCRNGYCTPVYEHIAVRDEYCFARFCDDTTEIFYGRYDADSLVMLNRNGIPDYLEYISNDLFYDLGSPRRDPTFQMYHRIGDTLKPLPYKFHEEVVVGKGNGLYNTDELRLVIIKGEHGYGVLGESHEIIIDAVHDEVDIELNVNMLIGKEQTSRTMTIPEMI